MADVLVAFNTRASKVPNLAGAQFLWNDDRGYYVRFVSGLEENLGLRHEAEAWLRARELRAQVDGNIIYPVHTYDFLGPRFVGVEIEVGDLLLQVGPHACIWRVRAPLAYEDGGDLGYVAELAEEGASPLVYSLERLRADGVSGPNNGPLIGVYPFSPKKLTELRTQVAEELASWPADK